MLFDYLGFRLEVPFYVFFPPAWRELSAGESAPVVQEEGPSTFLRGWQGQAAAAEARRHRETLQAPILLPKRSCTPSPGLSLAVSSLQCQSHQPCPIPAISSVLLLRRLRLPLPLAGRTCRRRRLLDPFGDHRAACARSGVLRWSVRPHALAEKLEPESPPTHALRT